MSDFVIETDGTAIDDLKSSLEPLNTGDGDLGVYLTSIAGMLQEVEDYARDTPTYVGWGKLLNISTAPATALDWLGQFVGVKPLGGLTEAQIRARIVAKEGFARGSVKAMRSAAQTYLTGTKTVNFYERDTSPYHLTVTTYESETPAEDLPTTNLMINGGFETNTAGWGANGGGVTAIRDAGQAKFGSWALKVVTPGSITNEGVFWVAGGAMAGVAVGQPYMVSAYVIFPVGVPFVFGAVPRNGAANLTGTAVAYVGTGAWQRVTCLLPSAPATTNNVAMTIYTNAVVATTFWVDGAQIENHSVATPYVETDGAQASRLTGFGPVGTALREQKPAGIQLTYSITLGQTWAAAKAANATWTIFKATYATWDNARRAF